MKKKILFLIHTLGVGGAEKVLLNLVNNMDKTKYDVTVMTVINTGAFINQLDKDIKYKYIFSSPFSQKNKRINKRNEQVNSGSLLNKTSKIKKVLASIYQFMWRNISCKIIYKVYIKEKYDVEIAFLEGITAKIISASNNKESKKIAWIHVDLINERKSEKVFRNREDEKKTYEKFDKIVAVSQNVRESFLKKNDINKEKVIVKYNTIDSIEIIEKANEKVDDVEKKKKFTMCTVGRLNTQKGYDRLLKVVQKLKEEKFEFELWIIGVGPDEKKLQEYIKDNKLENTVKLLGYKSNPYKYIKKSDLFVCSSRAEGFSTVVCEATILGIPTVTTNCSGMKEILGENNEYGLVTENNEEELLNGIKTILENEQIYNYYKENVKMAQNKFEIKKAVKEIENMIEESCL